MDTSYRGLLGAILEIGSYICNYRIGHTVLGSMLSVCTAAIWEKELRGRGRKETSGGDRLSIWPVELQVEFLKLPKGRR